MFGRQKKRPLYKEISDKSEVVNDFRLRSSRFFESYRPLAYRFFDGLREEVMVPKLDDHLQKLNKGELDSGSGNALDGIIVDVSIEAILDLWSQRTRHLDMLQRLSRRRETDPTDLKSMRLVREKELQELLAERAELLERLRTNYNNTSLEKED